MAVKKTTGKAAKAYKQGSQAGQGKRYVQPGAGPGPTSMTPNFGTKLVGLVRRLPTAWQDRGATNIKKDSRLDGRRLKRLKVQSVARHALLLSRNLLRREKIVSVKVNQIY